MKGIKGLIETSFSDWDGKVCSVIFLSNCNFRCPFCFNKELVLGSPNKDDIKFDYVLERLKVNKDYIDGVCITGGEPTLNTALPSALRKIKDLGLKVKLDTNGSQPAVLKYLIESNLVDYVAMDIKTSEEFYDKAAGVKVKFCDIKKSIDIIKQIRHEFRTTVIKPFFNERILKSILEVIGNDSKYVLQEMDSRREFLDTNFKPSENYSKEELNKFFFIVKEKVKDSKLRLIN